MGAVRAVNLGGSSPDSAWRAAGEARGARQVLRELRRAVPRRRRQLLHRVRRAQALSDATRARRGDRGKVATSRSGDKGRGRETQRLVTLSKTKNPKLFAREHQKRPRFRCQADPLLYRYVLLASAVVVVLLNLVAPPPRSLGRRRARCTPPRAPRRRIARPGARGSPRGDSRLAGSPRLAVRRRGSPPRRASLVDSERNARASGPRARLTAGSSSLLLPPLLLPPLLLPPPPPPRAASLRPRAPTARVWRSSASVRAAASSSIGSSPGASFRARVSGRSTRTPSPSPPRSRRTGGASPRARSTPRARR